MIKSLQPYWCSQAKTFKFETVRKKVFRWRTECNRDATVLKPKRRRRTIPRTIYEATTWGVLLKDPRIQDPSTPQGKLFRTRFRVPYPKFLELVEFSKENNIRVNKDGVPIKGSFTSNKIVSIFVLNRCACRM